MCGGFTITKDIKKAASRFNVTAPLGVVNPRFNARPLQNLPVILNSDITTIQIAHWGITPGWAKKQEKRTLLINVRIESANKFTFNEDFNRRRCLVLADGFFEWEKTKSGKQPHYFRLKSREIFAFAGIWEEDTDLKQRTFAILTMEPNALVKRVHNRMPVILQPHMEQEWISSDENVHKIITKIKAYPSTEMEEYEISQKVNVAYNDSPNLLQPI